MKILASTIEKLFTPYVLIALNVAIILLAEFAGGGTFFAATGLAYLIAVLFVGLIIVRIFSDYAFSDYILKGFLKIQLTFLLFLGLVQFYEYFALNIFSIRPDVVQLTVVASYFMWILSLFLALGFVFRIYYKQSSIIMATLWGLFLLCFAGLIAPNVSTTVVSWFPVWFPKLILMGIVVSATAGIFAVKKLSEIMPVFVEYSHYAIPATILLVLTGFSEYFEATGGLQSFGISAVQNVYISHFLVYAALSLLLIGFGKLKRPQGIYADM
ncbi:MAG: hypothetical protein M0P64_01300 [Candidatus Pacebacteria bacterium]|jgi:hypothetical protein|nr:hypothetical protein [Candidatus Paceibacterota bacterium]